LPAENTETTCESNSITENLETPRRRTLYQKMEYCRLNERIPRVIDVKWFEKSTEGAKINGCPAGRWKNDICLDLIEMAIEFLRN
jgi:hypothetical protein